MLYSHPTLKMMCGLDLYSQSPSFNMSILYSGYLLSISIGHPFNNSTLYGCVVSLWRLWKGAPKELSEMIAMSSPCSADPK